MKFVYSNQVRQAWHSVCSQKLRMSFVILGVSLALALLTALSHLQLRGKQEINTMIQALGPDQMILMNVSKPKVIASLLIPLIGREQFSLYKYHPETLFSQKGEPLSFTVIECEPEFIPLSKLQLHQGRSLLSIDKGDPVVLLGDTVSQSVESGVFIGGKFFSIIGRLHPLSIQFLVEYDLNRVLLIPNDITEGPASVLLNMRGRSPDFIERRVLEHVHEYGLEPILVKTANKVIAPIADQLNQFSWLLGAITLMTLFLAVLLLLNQFFMLATERRSEIGMRLAMGALAHHILSLFLLEALFIGLLSALVGICLGEWLAYYIMQSMGWPFGGNIPLYLIIVSFSITLSILISAIPTWQALQKPVAGLIRTS